MSIAGARPEIRSAISRPVPAAMVQPSVPWPVAEGRVLLALAKTKPARTLLHQLFAMGALVPLRKSRP